MPRIPRYRLRRFVEPGGYFHLARVTYPRGQVCAVHRHDFAEVFWIERGQATHLINGRRQTLDAGDVVLIRPDDAHGFRSPRPSGFVLVNVAFERSVIDFIRARYFKDYPAWPGAGDAMPATWTLPPAAVPLLAERAERLSMARQSQLDLECFLLRLLQLLRDATLVESHGVANSEGDTSRGGTSGGGGRPVWLGQALTRFTDRAVLDGNAADLARIAGCSTAHLNRVVRHSYGVTTTDLINRLRLERAAHRLRMSDDPITRVALDCGFENLGYFYRCFTRHFRTTPRRHRMAGLAPVR
jgi:AraC-like DNA-binding protein/quercetin dioxygenase-like cupin family protein